MRIALIGLPGAGKSTLFDFVAEAKGVPEEGGGRKALVLIPDDRLAYLSEVFKPKKTTYAQMEWWDGPWGGAGREGVKGDPWEAAHAADFLVHVVRDFVTDTYAYRRSEADPELDEREIVNELSLADLSMLDRRAGKLRESIKKPTPKRESEQQELALVEKMKEFIEQGGELVKFAMSEDERKIFRGFRFLSEKKYLVARVRGEGGGEFPPGQLAVYPVLEREMKELAKEEADWFRQEWRIPEGGRVKFIREVLRAAGGITFFTVGEDEVKAWLIPDGFPAVKAAGVIHTDFERGFIRAEVISYQDFVQTGAMKKGGKDGRVRAEGKEYQVRDGDIIEFKFNV